MSNVVYTPVQERPENQDPGVAFIVNEQTGERRPLPAAPARPKRTRKAAPAPEPVVEAPVEVPAEPVVELEAEQPGE